MAQLIDKAPSFSKAAYAYETPRRQILDGAHQPGDRLRLADSPSPPAAPTPACADPSGDER